MKTTVIQRRFALIFLLAAMIAGLSGRRVEALDETTAESKPLVELQREVDDLLAKQDPVQSRRGVALIFELAKRLRGEKRDADARRYLEAGLAVNSWALEEQLSLGELLARAGQPEALREKAAMVLRRGEEPSVLARAAEILGWTNPVVAQPLAKFVPFGPTLVLFPIGEIHPLVLTELGEALHRRLGVAVLLATCEVKLPPARRTSHQRWCAQTRARLLETAKAQPHFAAQLGAWGFTVAQLEADDAVVVRAVRKITAEQEGEEALRQLDAMLRPLAANHQWDVEEMLAAVNRSAGPAAKGGTMVLAVTAHDLCSDNANYLFGVAATGRLVGVISAHRFCASFNGEAPQRERLVGRLGKQALSTFGFMLGIPRCATPECARAFPQSLAEHDQKPFALCAQCRSATEAALGRKLPAQE